MTAPSAPGCLGALEGIDGCGKSTQARRLAERCGALLTREPGASELGRRLRALLLEQDTVAVGDRSEALLMAADRAQHVVEVLRPTLASGRWVVSDRYSASTLAYQGYGRGLDVDALHRLVHFATDGLQAHCTVLIDVPFELSLARRHHAPDRLEGLGEDFLRRVHRGYRELAAGDRTWVVVDGSGSEDEVAAQVTREVTAVLGPLPPAP